MNTAQKSPDELLEIIAKQDKKIQQLEQQLRMLLFRQHTPKSEKISADQLPLFEAQNEETIEPAPEEEFIDIQFKRKRRGKRKALDTNLERKRIEHTLSDLNCQCGCGGVYAKFDEVISEQCEMIPARYIVIEHVQFKYVCSGEECCEKIKLAPKPAQPIEKSIAGPGLLAHITTAKLVDSVPLYRQEKQHQRHGVTIPRNTMARWLIMLADLVLPLINLFEDAIRAGPYIQCDETPYQVLKEDGRKATSKSYIWVRRGGAPGHVVVLYHYDPTRSSQVARKLFEDYCGYVQCDGYSGYLCLEAMGILLVGCMAHLRRKFYEALKAIPNKEAAKKAKAAKGLQYIQKLYAIEKEVKHKSAEQRYQVRQEKAVPILDEFKVWLDQESLTVLPGSLLGKAISYALNQWVKVIRYCDDGCLEIDNNWDEQAVRPIAIGRKNFLFSDTPGGAHANTRLYSLIETGKVHGHEPYAYLRYLYEMLPSAKTVEDFEKLLPWNLDSEHLKQRAREIQLN